MAPAASTSLRAIKADQKELWKEALAGLSAEDREQYKDSTLPMLEVLKQVRG